MMNMKQFKAWKEMQETNYEYADEVLRYFRDLVTPIPTPEEAINNLIADDYEGELPLGIANHPKFGLANQAAQKLVEMV